MNPLRLVFAEARKGMWSLLALALLLGLSIGSGVCITSVEKAVRAGAARAGDDFDLIIGAQGSATDLVLSGVYLRENTLKLIPGELLSGIRRSKGTAWAAPLAFGDRWGRYPVVGTSADLVTLGGKRGVAEGRLFTRPGEAVVGASVPSHIGEHITPQHGHSRGGHESHSFTVVGRLQALGSAWDKAVLVPVETLWILHGLLPHEDMEKPAGAVLNEGRQLPGIACVVVKPVGVADAYRLRSFWSQKSVVDGAGRAVPLQGVFTGEVLTSLFSDLGGVRDLLFLMAIISEGIALAGVVLVSVTGVQARRPLLMRLRVLGAGPGCLLLTVWCLTSLGVVLGCLFALAFGWGGALGCARYLAGRTDILIPVTIGREELLLILVSFGAGLVAAILPALAAYRTK